MLYVHGTLQDATGHCRGSAPLQNGAYANTKRSIVTVMYQHETPHAQDAAEIQSSCQSWKWTTSSPQLNPRIWHHRNIIGVRAFNFPCTSTGCMKCSHRKAGTMLVVEPRYAEQELSCQILGEFPLPPGRVTTVSPLHRTGAAPSALVTLCKKKKKEESNLFYFNSCT